MSESPVGKPILDALERRQQVVPPIWLMRRCMLSSIPIAHVERVVALVQER